MRTDSELLHAYANRGDDAAFAEVVRRHMNLVYASSVRLLNGNATLAEDVTQEVFADLARKAAELAGHATVVGWLHTSVRYAAGKAIRGALRRQAREQEACTMSQTTVAEDTCWAQLRPMIDEAVGELQTPEREAVLLRFFEEKSHREVGEALGVTENAARMRVERAVEKLRSHFIRQGLPTSAALLAATLGAHAASAPIPAALGTLLVGKSVTEASTGTTTGGGWLAWLSSKGGAGWAGAAVLAIGGLALGVTHGGYSGKVPTLVTTTKAVAPAAPNPGVTDMNDQTGIVSDIILADGNSKARDSAATIAILPKIAPTAARAAEPPAPPAESSRAAAQANPTLPAAASGGLMQGGGQKPAATAEKKPEIIWTIQKLKTPQSITGLVWGANQFVAISLSGDILTSIDGKKWTVKNIRREHVLRAIAWNGQRYVVVGDHGLILTSDDGEKWVKREATGSDSLNGVEWFDPADFERDQPTGTKRPRPGSEPAGGQFIATGAEGALLRSPDGLKWRKQSNIVTARIYSVAYNGRQFLAAGNRGRYLQSADGARWRPYVLDSNIMIHGITWGNNLFVATTRPTYRVEDPVLAKTQPAESTAAPAAPTKIILTPGDKLPSATTSPAPSAALSPAAADAPEPAPAHPPGNEEPSPGFILTSTDGMEWTHRLPLLSMPDCKGLDQVIWTGHFFLAVGMNGKIVLSENGREWVESATGLQGEIFAAATNGEVVVAVGAQGMILTTPMETLEKQVTQKALAVETAARLVVEKGRILTPDNN